MGFALKADDGLTQNLLGFWRFDPASQCIHADGGVCAAFDVVSEEGRRGTGLTRFVEKIHPDDREPFAISLRAAAKSGTTFSHSFRITDDYPEPRPVFALGRVFHDEAGGSRYYVGGLFEAGAAKFHGHARLDMVNYLIAALEVARGLEEDIMARLIEAVLLEAGRRLATTIGRMPDGTH